MLVRGFWNWHMCCNQYSRIVFVSGVNWIRHAGECHHSKEASAATACRKQTCTSRLASSRRSCALRRALCITSIC